MRKLIRLLLGLFACAALIYGGVKMTAYLRESGKSIQLKEALIEDAVVVKEQAPVKMETVAIETPEEAEPDDTVPIEVDFDVLREKNEDVIAWLYSPDTPVNLPVVQSSDNSYYLRRLLDGTWNNSGSLFADYRNAADFSDANTIIYGHNMNNDEMFGTLPNYNKQSYFDEHPVLWLLTPEGNYEVELVAGFLTESKSDVYSFGRSGEAVYEAVRQAMKNSTFASDVEIAPEDRFLTLSTCSYEYENARYVLIGRLTAVE